MMIDKIKASKLGQAFKKSCFQELRIKRKKIKSKKAEALKFTQKWYPSLSNNQTKKIAKDMVHCLNKYYMRFFDYTAFHIENVPENERETFITDYTRHLYYASLNEGKNEKLFKHKDLTYARFREYFKRELYAFTKLEQEKDFYHFLQKHGRVIIKPLTGSLGKRIQIISQADYSKLLSEYTKGFVAEELIQQHEQMSILNPESVNTIRMTTVRCDDHVEFLMPMLKCGRKGKCVDNAGSGGVLCEVDLATGKVVRAVSKMGEPMTHHPDSGLSLIGFEIPCWKEAIDFAEQLCTVVPENHYTGWDIALTSNGWVLVEGNSRGEFGMQILNRKGIKPKMDEILCKLNIPIPQVSNAKELLDKFRT